MDRMKNANLFTGRYEPDFSLYPSSFNFNRRFVFITDELVRHIGNRLS